MHASTVLPMVFGSNSFFCFTSFVCRKTINLLLVIIDTLTNISVPPFQILTSHKSIIYLASMVIVLKSLCQWKFMEMSYISLGSIKVITLGFTMVGDLVKCLMLKSNSTCSLQSPLPTFLKRRYFSYINQWMWTIRHNSNNFNSSFLGMWYLPYT